MTTARTVALTHARLQELLNYDPETGAFTWKVATNNRIRVGDKAGSPSGDGYTKICIDGTGYIAGRLAWFYMYGKWPDNLVDHQNRNRSNDQISNLRDATASENSRNRSIQPNNITGVIGVHWDKREKKYHARIKSSEKRISLGYFKTLEEAAFARREAEIKYFGDFART